MEGIKERIPMILACIIAVIIGGVAYYFLEYYEAVYYTQIDNTKVQKIEASDEMNREYTLECYDENGQKKEIKFKASRELREDAYLMLEVRITGVHTWKEVQYNELPEKVKTHYQE